MDDKIFRAMSHNSKIITNIDNTLRLHTNEYKNNQNIKYVQLERTKSVPMGESRNVNPTYKPDNDMRGQLQMYNDKCITNSDNRLTLQQCDASNIAQYWKIHGNKFVNTLNNTCIIANNNDNLSVGDCKSQYSDFTVINNEYDESPEYNYDDYHWPTSHKGKTVVLVSNDNPFYINKDITIPTGEPVSASLNESKYLTYKQGDVRHDPTRGNLDDVDKQGNLIIDVVEIDDNVKRSIIEQFDNINHNIHRNMAQYISMVVLLVIFYIIYMN